MVFNQFYDPYSPYQYPWMGVNFFFALWFASLCTYKMLARFGSTKRKFQSLSEDKKRNVVAYIFQVIITTAVLGLQIYGGRDIVFQGLNETTPERIEACCLVMLLVVTLYIWELCYRINTSFHLMLHHVVTILLYQVGFASFFDTKDVVYLRGGLILTFYATTEQLSFVALIAYRLDVFRQHHSWMFFLAAVQIFVFKTAVTVGGVVHYGISIHRGIVHDDGAWGKFWMIGYMFLVGALFVAQVYASWILYLLGVKCKSRSKQEHSAAAATTTTTTNGCEKVPTKDKPNSELDGDKEGDMEASTNESGFGSDTISAASQGVETSPPV